jgi:hypothetical protein
MMFDRLLLALRDIMTRLYVTHNLLDRRMMRDIAADTHQQSTSNQNPHRARAIPCLHSIRLRTVVRI